MCAELQTTTCGHEVCEIREAREPALWVTLWAALGAGHSLSIAQRERDTHATAYCLEAMARLAVVEDDSGQALHLYGGGQCHTA